MAKRTILIPATWDNQNRKKDRSVRGSWTSNLEVSNEEFALMDTFHGSSGFLMFAENEFTDADIPTEDAPNDTKTPSARLRSTLFVYHQQQGITEPFNIWYATQVEKFISSIKERLE